MRVNIFIALPSSFFASFRQHLLAENCLTEHCASRKLQHAVSSDNEIDDNYLLIVLPLAGILPPKTPPELIRLGRNKQTRKQTQHDYSIGRRGSFSFEETKATGRLECRVQD